MSQAPSPHAKFYVYVHVKADDGEPFYVGKGQAKRAWTTSKRSTWWKNVVAKHGLVVKIQKHFQDESEAFASEIETIAILRDLGYELCNLTDGGEGASGYKPGVETRLKLVERNRRRWSDPIQKSLAREKTRLMWTDEKKRAELCLSMSRAAAGESNPASTLTDEDIRTIHRLGSKGIPQRLIAEQMSCSQQHVSKILSGDRRPDIYKEFHPTPS